jgi:hypothetical protein
VQTDRQISDMHALLRGSGGKEFRGATLFISAFFCDEEWYLAWRRKRMERKIKRLGWTSGVERRGWERGRKEGMESIKMEKK